jgi:predicted aconitase
MLSAVNTKILVLILAALTALGAVLFKIEQHTAEQAAIARQQQADRDRIRKEDEEFRKQVEEQKKKSHAFAGNQANTWQNYIP